MNLKNLSSFLGDTEIQQATSISADFCLFGEIRTSEYLDRTSVGVSWGPCKTHYVLQSGITRLARSPKN